MTTTRARVRRRGRLLALLAAASLAATAHGSSTRFFQATAQGDFLRGELENLSVDNRGQLTLGPASALVYETAAPFLWALSPGADGSFFVGTGNEGRVFRIGGEGQGALFFDAAELEAHALAPAPDGGLYVASSPDGRIYKVDRGGQSTTFFEPGEKYIWALATDPRGFLYAATGERGAIYRIAPDGTGSRFYQAKATNVTALTIDRAGNLLVGTESPGRVLRVDANGRGFVLLDSPYQEIRSLRFDDRGSLYVAAVGAPVGGGGPPPSRQDERTSPAGDTPPTPVVTVSAEITSIAIVDTTGGAGSSGSTTREDRRAARGAVYRIAPDGLWDLLWESREDSPYDLALDRQGRVIVGTGSRGRIYRLEGDPPQPTLLARADAQQVTALHLDAAGRLYYATANPGKLFRLDATRAARGTYESHALDAQMVSTWGALRWRGTTPQGSRIELFTRSGNTDAPDDTWSPWSDAYTLPDGSPIASPNARYLQWRAVLTGGTEAPVLTSVSAAYLQRNLRPIVRSITVHPPGIVFQKPFTTGDPDLAGFENQTTPDRQLTQAALTAQQGGTGSPSLGRRTYQKGLQTLLWRADDENGDDLSYDVLYRREGETAWKALRRELLDPILVWDTTTVPNGRYFVKIVASDAPSNAASMTLVGELDSTAFDIDNTPPSITVQSVRTDGDRTVVTFETRDDHSPIQRMEYSPDGRQWRGVFPVDGMADSRTERYELTVEGPIGPRGIALRALDSMNNVGTAQVDSPRP
jgi:hypothetical protein